MDDITNSKEEWTGWRVQYLKIRYCHEIARQVDVLKNLRAYYDQENNELVGIEIRDAKLFFEELEGIMALNKIEGD